MGKSKKYNGKILTITKPENDSKCDDVKKY